MKWSDRTGSMAGGVQALYGSATWHSPPTWKSACGWVAAWSQKLALAPAAGDAVAPGTLFGQVSASVSRPGAGTLDHGWPPRRHRPQAGTAIRWPRATPPRDPFSHGAFPT